MQAGHGFPPRLTSRERRSRAAILTRLLAEKQQGKHWLIQELAGYVALTGDRMRRLIRGVPFPWALPCDFSLAPPTLGTSCTPPRDGCISLFLRRSIPQRF